MDIEEILTTEQYRKYLLGTLQEGDLTPEQMTNLAVVGYDTSKITKPLVNNDGLFVHRTYEAQYIDDSTLLTNGTTPGVMPLMEGK